jgi:hypothetical protein
MAKSQRLAFLWAWLEPDFASSCHVLSKLKKPAHLSSRTMTIIGILQTARAIVGKAIVMVKVHSTGSPFQK